MTERMRLCALDDLTDGEAARFEVDGVGVSVVRLGDDVYAIGARCTHQDVDLTDGEVVPEDLSLECPKHGSGFCLTTGEALSLPATRGVPVFDTVVIDGEVMVSTP
jgi:3-phenylpropionate/trans-cinnamate dioxygenase ferredoxin subunit